MVEKELWYLSYLTHLAGNSHFLSNQISRFFSLDENEIIELG